MKGTGCNWLLPQRGGCGSGTGRGLRSGGSAREVGTLLRGAGASCLPAVSPGADAAGRGFTLAACSLGRGHFRTHAQPRGCRSRVGGADEQGAAQAAPRLPGVLRFPSHRASGVRSRPCLQTGFQRKFVVFLFLPPLPLFPQSGQRQIRQGRGPWRRRGPLSHRGWPSGLSEPVSSPVSRRIGRAHV